MVKRQKTDFHAQNIYVVPPHFFKEQGAKVLLVDLDNTLDPYTAAEPSTAAIKAIQAIRLTGIKTYLISNNKPGRVSRYAKILKVDGWLASAHKPNATRVLAFLKSRGYRPKDCLAIGDQVFTDRKLASKAGFRFILTKPLTKRDQPFTIVLRILETPVRHRWERAQLLGPDIGQSQEKRQGGN